MGNPAIQFPLEYYGIIWYLGYLGTESKSNPQPLKSIREAICANRHLLHQLPHPDPSLCLSVSPNNVLEVITYVSFPSGQPVRAAHPRCLLPYSPALERQHKEDPGHQHTHQAHRDGVHEHGI